MADNLCQKEYDEYVEAMKEWVQVAEGTRKYMVTQPLEPFEGIESKCLEYYNQMLIDHKREEAARNRYFEKFKSWIDCRRAHEGITTG